MTEYQFFFNVATAIVSVTFGWVLNTIWGSLKDLQTADKALVDKVAAIEILVAGRYVTRDEFNVALTAISSKLDRIQDLLSQKADR
ncbi:MAG: hypothetical protein WCJ62_00095 [Flavobacterium sp.]|jgi:hypothetical protein